MSARRHTKTESVLCILLFLLARKLKTMENHSVFAVFYEERTKGSSWQRPDHIYTYVYKGKGCKRTPTPCLLLPAGVTSPIFRGFFWGRFRGFLGFVGVSKWRCLNLAALCFVGKKHENSRLVSCLGPPVERLE